MKTYALFIYGTFFTILCFSACNNNGTQEELMVKDSLASILNTKFNNSLTVKDLKKILQDNATGPTYQIMFEATVLAKRKIFLNPSATVFGYSGIEPNSGLSTVGYDSLSKDDTIHLIGTAFLHKDGAGLSVSDIDYEKKKH